MEGIMEGSPASSENDMSFELTGPLRIIPFPDSPSNRYPKRNFNDFAADPAFRPAEQNDRAAFNGSVHHQTSGIDGYDSQQEPSQLPSWILWGIYRSLEAVQFTSNLLQAVYAATLFATTPVAAAKRRLVSITREVPAPAPVRRILSSRHTSSRIFRQNHSPSPGHRATTYITPPRFKPRPTSPFHVPGSFPVSPLQSPNYRPATRVSPLHESGNFSFSPPMSSGSPYSTPTPVTANTNVGASVSPNNANEDSIYNIATAAVGVPMFSEDAMVDNERALDDDEYMDDTITPVYEPLSPINYTPVVLSEHQLASINQLKAIQTMFKAELPISPPKHQILGQKPSVSSGSSGSAQPLLKSSGQQPLVSSESIELTRSLPDNLGQQPSESNTSLELAQPSSNNLGREPSESGELIESTRSSPKKLGPKPSKVAKKNRKSVLREMFDGANSIRKPKTNKSARFLDDPVARIKKYIINEAISYPSPHSSRDEDSILSSTSVIDIGHASPTQQEQQAMVDDQLMICVPEVSVHSVGVTPSELDIAFHSSPAIHKDSELPVEYGVGPESNVASGAQSVTNNQVPTTSSPDSVVNHENPGSSSLVRHDGHDSSKSPPARDTASSQVPVTPRKARGRSPATPQNLSQVPVTPKNCRGRSPATPQNLTNRIEELDLSGRRSSCRLQRRDELIEQRRREQEAIAAEEQARKDQAEAEKKARKAAAEVEERARKAREEAEERARKDKEEAEEKARKQAEDEEKLKKRALRVPVDKVIRPLTDEWEQRVAAALAQPLTKTVAHTSRRTPITRAEIGKVLPQRGTGDASSGWLNDSIIDAYLQAVVDHGNEAAGQTRGDTPKFHAFNSFFYTNLRDGGYDKVRRWAKKAKIGGDDLLKVEWVFMPVNVGENHWTLIAVSPTRKTMEYYDSFHGRVTHEFQKIRAWLKGELGNKYKAEEWTVVEDPALRGKGKGPTQHNGKDCGVFTVTTAKMISLGVDPMAYTASDMATQRKRMVAELINGGFTDEFEPNIRFN